MKLELIIVSYVNHNITHITASGSKTIELDKKTMGVESIRYIEGYCNEMGFDLLAPHVESSLYIYHLVKK